MLMKLGVGVGGLRAPAGGVGSGVGPEMGSSGCVRALRAGGGLRLGVQALDGTGDDGLGEQESALGWDGGVWRLEGGQGHRLRVALTSSSFWKQRHGPLQLLCGGTARCLRALPILQAALLYSHWPQFLDTGSCGGGAWDGGSMRNPLAAPTCKSQREDMPLLWEPCEGTACVERGKHWTLLPSKSSRLD